MLGLSRIAFLAVAPAIFCCISGCGDDGAADAIRKRRTNLRQLGAFYQAYYQDRKAAPASTTDLLDFMEPQAEGDSVVRDAITSLEEGDIVLVWNTQLENGGNSGDAVLGFEAGVPSTGGYVVMTDGQVALMTAKQFSESSLAQ